MRIIAGELGGRQFVAPHGHRTHPMSDKMRGALFNSLGNINGKTVLDPFAGTGALSFEALSRGAKSAVLIESDRNAQRAITENISQLDLAESATLIGANAHAWLRSRRSGLYDLILIDPPYDRLQYDLVEALSRRLAPKGRIVLSWPPKRDLPRFPNCNAVQIKDYGDSTLHFYRQVDYDLETISR